MYRDLNAAQTTFKRAKAYVIMDEAGLDLLSRWFSLARSKETRVQNLYPTFGNAVRKWEREKGRWRFPAAFFQVVAPAGRTRRSALACRDVFCYKTHSRTAGFWAVRNSIPQ
jgi:hypothetical protein